MLRQLDIYIQKNEVGSQLHYVKKINTRWIRDLNVRAKSIKLLEKKISWSLHDLELGDGFLEMTQKHKQWKKIFFNLLKKKLFILYGVWPVNNIVIVSGEQWRDSDMHIHISILPQTLLPSKLPHSIEQSSMCYTVGPCWLSILNSWREGWGEGIDKEFGMDMNKRKLFF